MSNSNQIIFTRLDQNLILNYEYTIYPLAGAISWGTVFGVKGILIGTALGTIDTLAINYKYYDHPYLTYGSIGLAVFSPLKDSPIVKEIINKVGSVSSMTPKRVGNIVRSLSSSQTFRPISEDSFLEITPEITPINSPVSPPKIINEFIENTSILSRSFFSKSLSNLIAYAKELTNFREINFSLVDIAGFTTGAIFNHYSDKVPADIFQNIFSNAIILYNLGTRDLYKRLNPNYQLPSQQLFLVGIALGLIDGAIVYFNYSKHFIISPFIRIFSIYESVFTISWSTITYLYNNPYFNIGLTAKLIPLIPNLPLEKFSPLLSPELIISIMRIGILSRITYDSYYNMQNKFIYIPEKKFTPVQVSNNLHSIYKRMIEERELNSIVDKQVITLLATKFLVISASLKIDANRGIIASKIASGITNANFDSVISDCINIGLTLGYFYGSNTIDHFTSDYFQAKRKFYSDNYFTETISKNEIAIYLSKNNSDSSFDSKVLIKNINEDLLIVSKDGSELLTSSISVYIGGIYALNFFYNNGYDCMYFSYLYSLAAGVISEFLAELGTKNDKIIKEYQEKIEALENYRIINAPSTSITNKGNFIKDKVKFYKDRLNIFVSDQTKFYSFNYLWNSFQDILYHFLSIYLVAGHADNQQVQKHVWIIIPLSVKLFKMNCYEAVMTSKLNNFNIAYERLESLLSRIEYALNFSYPKLIVEYIPSNSSAICIEHLYIDLVNNKKINIPQLCITQAKTAIVGSNGCGKTTFCKLLKNVPNYGITPEGKIIFYTKYINNADKIMMTSQNDLMVPGLSIYEEISSKIGEINCNDQSKILDLLQEIELFSYSENINSSSTISLYNDLNKPNNWENILSGGQKNKIRFVTIIFKATENPQIEFIIFDEIFEHMDSKSRILAKNMIDKYLSDRKVLIIDHNCNKNEDNFYDQKITFRNINNDSNYSLVVENYDNYLEFLEINNSQNIMCSNFPSLD